MPKFERKVVEIRTTERCWVVSAKNKKDAINGKCKYLSDSWTNDYEDQEFTAKRISDKAAAVIMKHKPDEED